MPPALPVWPVALLWLVLVNIWTFLRFGQDKSCAVLGMRRVPEQILLGLALVGGTAGAYAGRAHFRHKTRKQPFSTWLHLIAMLQTGAAVGLGVASRGIG